MATETCTSWWVAGAVRSPTSGPQATPARSRRRAATSPRVARSPRQWLGLPAHTREIGLPTRGAWWPHVGHALLGPWGPKKAEKFREAIKADQTRSFDRLNGKNHPGISQDFSPDRDCRTSPSLAAGAGGAVARGVSGVPVESVSCGVMTEVPPVWWPRAGGRRSGGRYRVVWRVPVASGASPVRVAPDRRPAGRRPRAVPAR